MYSRFAVSDHAAVIQPMMLCSGRQNLAALGTAAGKHLAAVGSSHSLAETVNLGAVTAAGLIGTLHSCTPPVKSHMLNSRKAVATQSIGPYMVTLAYYNRKNY